MRARTAYGPPSRAVRRGAPAAALVVAAVAAALGGRAGAYPLMAPRPTPDVIAGPTDPSVAAAFYNPAALGYLRGVHLLADGGVRGSLGSASRDGAGSSGIGWANPDAFAGVTWDLATETLDLGLAVFTPFNDLSSFPTRGPLRFHEQAMRFGSLEEVLAGAWQIERHVAIGAELVVDQNWIDYRFARDAAPSGGSATVAQPSTLCGGMPCGYENPLAEQELRLRGYANGIGFSVGAIVRPVERLWIGLSYTSHAAGDLSLQDNTRGRITPAPGQGPVCGGGDCFGDDKVLLQLPEMVQAGVRIVVNPKLDVEASWRFLHYGARAALDVSLQGGDLGNAAAPTHFALDRGLQNSYLVEVSTRHTLGPSLRLSPSLAFETSAVAPSAVNAAAIDAPKLDAALTLEWRAWHSGASSLFLGAHVGGTAYFLGHVDSRFSASAETACVDAGYSLDACAGEIAGDALPSASGNYTLFVINAGLALGFVYQP